jgi:hypothetical protein
MQLMIYSKILQTSLWREGKDFQHGLELQANLSLTSNSGGIFHEERLTTFKAKHSESPSWNQKMSFQLDVGQHTDIVLSIRLTLSDSRTEPWGLLRLPVYEVVSRGSHQGWFFLLDQKGNAFRK